MIGEYHIRKLIDPTEPSKGKEWKDMAIHQGRDDGYVIDWGYDNVQDITLYRKPTIDEWIQSGYMIPKNGIYKKLIDKHSFNN